MAQRRRQLGQAMTEYMIVFPVMLVLLFSTIQIALLYQAKTQLKYAAFESARSGALNHAERWSLNAGLVRGMAPLHTHGQGREWLRWARSKVWDDIDAGLLDIQIINPTEQAYSSHGIDIDGDTYIPNDNLMYRAATLKGDGSSRLSIQDANLLKIRVLYCAEMHVPFVNRMINSMLRLGNTPAATGSPAGAVGTGQLTSWSNQGVGFNAASDSFEETCLERGPRFHLPMAAEATIRMQTAPKFEPPPIAP